MVVRPQKLVFKYRIINNLLIIYAIFAKNIIKNLNSTEIYYFSYINFQMNWFMVIAFGNNSQGFLMNLFIEIGLKFISIKRIYT